MAHSRRVLKASRKRREFLNSSRRQFERSHSPVFQCEVWDKYADEEKWRFNGEEFIRPGWNDITTLHREYIFIDDKGYQESYYPYRIEYVCPDSQGDCYWCQMRRGEVIAAYKRWPSGKYK